MNIKDLVEDAEYAPKREASTNGGEYKSPCPFCKEGDNRFCVWPNQHDDDGVYRGGRYWCRKCDETGNAISFLMNFHGLPYVEACLRLRIEPTFKNNNQPQRLKPKTHVAKEPPDFWKEKSEAFMNWCIDKLESNQSYIDLLINRGLTFETITDYKLGYNPGVKGKDIFREREDWGLVPEMKENGSPRKLWLPVGVVVPTLGSDGLPAKVKIRRSNWKEGDRWPKYVEVSGSKQMPSIFGNISLPYAIVLESELDAILIQQEASDLVFCIALGGSTKPLDTDTDKLIKNTPLVLFLPDFDQAGAIAWAKWKDRFPDIQRILTPHGKSAGDYFLERGSLRKWLEAHIKECHRKEQVKDER